MATTADAERLKRIRKAVDKTQADVAAALGVEQPTVSRWEGGEAAPSWWRVRQLARLYGCPLDAIADDAALDLWLRTRTK